MSSEFHMSSELHPVSYRVGRKNVKHLPSSVTKISQFEVLGLFDGDLKVVQIPDVLRFELLTRKYYWDPNTNDVKLNKGGLMRVTDNGSGHEMYANTNPTNLQKEYAIDPKIQVYGVSNRGYEVGPLTKDERINIIENGGYYWDAEYAEVRPSPKTKPTSTKSPRTKSPRTKSPKSRKRSPKNKSSQTGAKSPRTRNPSIYYKNFVDENSKRSCEGVYKGVPMKAATCRASKSPKCSYIRNVCTDYAPRIKGAKAAQDKKDAQMWANQPESGQH
jgi:hypothetical protein